MVRCSPGCANTISGRGTSLDPGPVTMASAGVNHGCRLGCAAGADGSTGSGKVQGRQGTEIQGSALGRLRRALGVGGARLGPMVTEARACGEERQRSRGAHARMGEGLKGVCD